MNPLYDFELLQVYPTPCLALNVMFELLQVYPTPCLALRVMFELLQVYPTPCPALLVMFECLQVYPTPCLALHVMFELLLQVYPTPCLALRGPDMEYPGLFSCPVVTWSVVGVSIFLVLVGMVTAACWIRRRREKIQE